MRGALLTILVSLVLGGVCIGDTDRIEWGMTKDQVRQLETGEAQEEVKDGLPYVSYAERIVGLEATMTYGFDLDGRLFQIEYRITPDQSDREGSHRKVQEMLIGEYGRPNIQIVGPTTRRMEWEREDTTIRLSFDSSGSSFFLLHFNRPMYENLLRLRLALSITALEKEREEQRMLRNQEIISIASE